MEIITKETRIIDITTSLICNKCKKEVNCSEPEIDDWFRYYDRGGYFSEFGDGTEVLIDLCPKCYKEVLGPYAILEEG